jgi:hypothetical protein
MIFLRRLLAALPRATIRAVPEQPPHESSQTEIGGDNPCSRQLAIAVLPATVSEPIFGPWFTDR